MPDQLIQATFQALQVCSYDIWYHNILYGLCGKLSSTL